MQRDIKSLEYYEDEAFQFSTRHIHSWFLWTKCEVCQKEFRRESGWRLVRYIHPDYYKLPVYICGRCCPTKKLAQDTYGDIIRKPWKQALAAAKQ